jgi:hypothetical protein
MNKSNILDVVITRNEKNQSLSVGNLFVPVGDHGNVVCVNICDFGRELSLLSTLV